MARVLKSRSGSAIEFFYGDEDEGVYQPYGRYPVARVAVDYKRPKFGSVVKQAIREATRYLATPLASEEPGLFGRIEEEIFYPFERRDVPRFSVLLEVGGAGAPPQEFDQFFYVGDEPAGFVGF